MFGPCLSNSVLMDLFPNPDLEGNTQTNMVALSNPTSQVFF